MLGKPAEYLPIHQTFLHIPTTSSRIVKPYNTLADNTLRIQAIGLYYTGFLATKGPDLSLSK